MAIMKAHKASYPPDFRRALNHRLDEVKVEEYLKVSTPIFLSGPPMLPSVLKEVTEPDPDFDMSSKMVQGSLLGYKLGIFEETNIPFILERDSNDEGVNGMVAFCLTPQTEGVGSPFRN